MSRAYNFAAGPAALPEPVLRQAQADLLEWGDARASIAEISHRSPEFMQVAAEAEADLRRLLSVPDDYAVLFLPGGATTQQALVALNFAAPGQAADYVVSGHWGKVALKQVQAYVTANVAASGEADEGNPGEGGFGSILGNFLESSNVTAVRELVDLIKTQRAFELNSRVIETSDEMLQVVNNLKA